MLPLELDERRVFLFGVRESLAEPFRYLRLPADENDRLDGFLNLRAALANPTLRHQAVKRYAADATENQRRDLTEALEASAARALDIFAGVVPVKDSTETRLLGGLPALSRFIEVQVPEPERERASQMLLRILNGSLVELNQLARIRAGSTPMPRDEKMAIFMTQAVMALSDAFYYPMPVALRLDSFEQVQASVFQVVRAPGKTVVYIGCVLLVMGVLAMLYVRERRIWVWLTPQDSGRAQAVLALSTNRKTLDNERELAQLKTLLLASAAVNEVKS
jgi:cytochrome c biogenesis protein